jgi:hypothetical protein
VERIIEGTWEDVSRMGQELAGHRVRVIVLDPDASPVTPYPVPDEWLDRDFLAYCDREADEGVTLEQVLQATAKIQDSMARVLIEEERAERF